MNDDTARHKRKNKSHLARYRQIAMIMAKYRLEKMLRYIGLSKYSLVGWIFHGNPRRKMTYSEPERIRMAIEELGPSFVKLGQIISTRTDLLPPDYTKELSKLQSSLQPLPVEKMKKVISDELGRSADDMFLSLENPIGIASIGQVYSCGQINACTLADGTEVITKVQKPGVLEQIEEDMEILGRAAIYMTKYWKGAQQYDLIGIIEEIADTIKKETDYIQEGHNAEYFAQFFQEDQIEAERSKFKTTSEWKLMTVIRFIFMPIFALISFFAISMIWFAVDIGDSVTLGIEGLILAFGGFICLLPYPQVKRGLLRAHLQKPYSQGPNIVTGKQLYSFLPEGIHETSNQGEATIKWDVVDNIIQTKDYIFVQFHPSSALVVPKRAFPDE